MASNIHVEPTIYTSFEPVTGTWQYIVSDSSTSHAVIIDSVLDFDPAASRISMKSADTLLDIVAQQKLQVKYIMETHAHADHLTAARYLQQKLFQLGQPRPKIAIGKRITLVQNMFAGKYGVEKEELEGVFDKLWDDGEEFAIGDLKGKVMYLPGHTPDHVGYKIGGNVFTGDSIFNPDVGSARADFPGGSATDLWTSTQKLLALPEYFRLYTGHDYPPATREVSEGGEKWKAYTTVAEQKKENKHVKAGIREEDFVRWRKERDAGLGEPRLLNQAMQVNIRGGRLPQDEFFRIPVKAEERVLEMMRE